MKRTSITLGDQVQRYLEDWARQEDRPLAGLCSHLIETAIDEAIQRGRYKPTFETARINYHSLKELMLINWDKLNDYGKIDQHRLLSIRDGHIKPNELEIARLALVSGAAEDDIAQLPYCHWEGKEKANGTV